MRESHSVLKNLQSVFILIVFLQFCGGCSGSSKISGTQASSPASEAPASQVPASQPPAQAPSSTASSNQSLPTQQSTSILPRSYQTGALIYWGVATAYGDNEAITRILDDHQVSYDTWDSDQFNTMTSQDFVKYGTIIWPGGYAGRMSHSLTVEARERIRKAVTEEGVGFVGFCAGAFIAITPPAAPNELGPAWGLSIIPGDLLPYYHLEDEGTDNAIVKIQLPNNQARSLIWWGGPYFPDYPQGVIARYGDTGQSAIIQTWAGKGFVILSGPHPEAPQNWFDKLGLDDSGGSAQDIAWNLIDAVLKRQPLPSLN